VGKAGLLVIILGVAGLFAHLVVTVPPTSADLVTGGSWVAIGIGVALVLTALAQYGFGYGVFPLAIGVGVLVAQQATDFTERMHAPQPLLGILVTLLVGVGAIAVSYAEGGDEAVIRLPFFAVASLLSDIFVDFGSGWDDLMNLSTALFAAAFVITAVVVIYLDGDLTDAVSTTDYYANRLVLAAGVGVGVAAVLITAVATFDLAWSVDVLLTFVAVLGGYLVVPLLGFGALFALVGAETLGEASDDAVGDAIVTMEHGLAAIGALVAGFVTVAALVALIFGGPPGWLVAVLVVVAAGAAAVAARCGHLALTELARLIRSGAMPGRIAAMLDDLRRSDPVFRLLPG
jgi:hypothetical protein